MPRTIRRGHSGCKSCRKRGKKCDEAKPTCRACLRLRLDCSYGVDYSFRNTDKQSCPHEKAQPAFQASWRPPFARQKPLAKSRQPLCPPLDTEDRLDTHYLAHFTTHVLHILPGDLSNLRLEVLSSSTLRSAALCISASNLSMLNVQVQARSPAKDTRRSVYSPLVNRAHEAQARRYHNQVSHFHHHNGVNEDIPSVLISQTLLAYYHHFSTSHHLFHLSVLQTIQYASTHHKTLTRTQAGINALQIWYRLCVSHRLGKPPSPLLQGEREGESVFGPSVYPDDFGSVYLGCVLGMGVDDLVFDILIKTIEIRTKGAVFGCVEEVNRSSDKSRNVRGAAFDALKHLHGRNDVAVERDEAQRGFVQGEHLQGLLDIQRERLKVWKTRLRRDQLPSNRTFPTHRDAMNALYALLCEMMYQESLDNTSFPSSCQDALAQQMMDIISNLNLAISSTADIYTFSLSETLLQLVLVYKTQFLFEYILDTLWPNLESKTRGYEHSHYPTHLVKRIIGYIAASWRAGKDVKYVQPAVPEDIEKTKLLDIYHPIGLVVFGLGREGYFFEKTSLL